MELEERDRDGSNKSCKRNCLRLRRKKNVLPNKSVAINVFKELTNLKLRTKTDYMTID